MRISERKFDEIVIIYYLPLNTPIRLSSRELSCQTWPEKESKNVKFFFVHFSLFDNYPRKTTKNFY